MSFGKEFFAKSEVTEQSLAANLGSPPEVSNNSLNESKFLKTHSVRSSRDVSIQHELCDHLYPTRDGSPRIIPLLISPFDIDCSEACSPTLQY